MRRQQLVLLAAILLAMALVLVLVLRNRQPPLLPGDVDHAVFASARDCLRCHGPTGQHPQPRNHPRAQDCLRCHGR